MYPIVRVNSERAVALEQLGTKGKFWYTGDDERRMLFKAEERGTGEDWAEKVVCELATLLGVPHVNYEMARDIASDKPGVVCASMVEEGEQLVHGNTLLFALDLSYPRDERRHRTAAHTIEAVSQAVGLLRPPDLKWAHGVPDRVDSALGVFVGYILLDAWTANQDRHHENWGSVWDSRVLRLAPSFDHGAALARLLRDEEREERLRTKDRNRTIAHYASRARSALFATKEDRRPLTTLEAFEAFAALEPDAASAWRARLHLVDEETVAGVLGQVPPDRLSAVGREFTLQLLLENRKRILAPRDEQR